MDEGVRRGGGAPPRVDTPREQLLAIFDVFDEWFHRDDFEGCSFINVFSRSATSTTRCGSASAAHLEYIRSVVKRIAEEAGVERGGGVFRVVAHPHEGLDRDCRRGGRARGTQSPSDGRAAPGRALAERDRRSVVGRRPDRPGRGFLGPERRRGRPNGRVVVDRAILPACVPETAEQKQHEKNDQQDSYPAHDLTSASVFPSRLGGKTCAWTLLPAPTALGLPR